MKRAFSLIFALVLLVCMTACVSNADREAANRISEKISQINENGFPTLIEAKALEAEYNSLSAKQKDLVENYGILQNFLSMNLDAMAEVQSKIDSASANSPYNDLKQIHEKYDDLASDEKSFIMGYDTIEKALSLSIHDEIALVAANFIKTFLKDADSMKITSALVYDYLSDTSLVGIDFSARNSFGADVSSGYFVMVNSSEMKIDTVYELTALTDIGKASLSLLEFFDFDSAERLDCDKLNDYLQTSS